MKYSFRIYRLITSLVFVVLLLSTYLWQELHYVLGHEHAVAIECENHGSKDHLHSFEWHDTDCFICQFHLSPLKKSVRALKAFHEFPELNLANFKTFTFTPLNQLKLPELRGPPYLS